MAETTGKAKPWTDGEKMAFFFQIIEKNGSIPWDELTLPEGRTKKSVQVMVDREKQKVKKAREAAQNGTAGDGSETPKKRGGAEGNDEASPKKKAKTPRKKKVKAGDEAETVEEEPVKNESEEDEA